MMQIIIIKPIAAVCPLPPADTMAIPFFNQKSDYLHPGDPGDPRLFHADPSDQILVWSPQVGDGYQQIIPLQAGLTLAILDCSIHRTFSYRPPRQSPFLEFEFQLEGPAAGQSTFVPHVFQRDGASVRTVHRRELKIEVLLAGPLLKSYAHTVVEHLPPQDQATLYSWASQVYRDQRGDTAKSPQAAFDYVLSGAVTASQISGSDDPFKDLGLYQFGHFWRSQTADMRQVIHQILHCPHRGQLRQSYLAERSLALVGLMLARFSHSEAISYPLIAEDLDRIYAAGRILAGCLNDPPSVATLARLVGLNRLKLNHGFRQVYGTTPFRFLKSCRLSLAQHLLTTSDLDVEVIAHQVGYTSRSNFASAFRQWFGLNPKALQLHHRSVSQPQSRAS